MSGQGNGQGKPPEGTPEGSPGGDDEYRSVVFDESFVKAARIQEYSARERLDGAARAVRIRHVLPRGLARQATALILLIVLAFGFAIYMGIRHPYKANAPGASQQLRVALIPLVPTGTVAAVSATAPFDGTPAENYRVGLAGLAPPADVQRVGGFAESEVREAFSTAEEYLADSGVDPLAVTGGDVSKVRELLDPGQQEQFDASLTRPTADGQHEATGWLVRFDPAAEVRLVSDGVRVQGTLDAAGTSDNQLQISTDHTFVYAVTGPGAEDGKASLFTVRRQMTFRFTHQDLEQHQVEVVEADVAAGPLPCSAPVQGFRPVLAGSATSTLTGADPYDRSQPVGTVCAPLSGYPVTPSVPASAPTTTPTTGVATATAAATGSGSPAAGPSGPSGPTSSTSPASRSRAQPQSTRPVTAASAVSLLR
ncbi:MAG: hypothetical protein QOF98_49 [Streptomyces sp.]|nr:hypothetical protein [Streptomyces sp.]